MNSKNGKKMDKKKIVSFIFMLAIVCFICVFFINKKIEEKNTYAGKYEKDGTAVYASNIVNKSYNRATNKKSIEIKSIRDDMNSIVLSNSTIDKIKNGDEVFNKKLNDVLDDTSIQNKDSYNIKKAIECGIVTGDTKYKEYFAIVTGFKESKQLVKFCENAFKIMEKDNKL